MLSTEPSLELNGAEPDQTTLLRLFVEHSPAAIAMFDRNLRYLLASRQWREDHGFGDRGVRGHCHGDFAVVSEQAKAVYRRCLTGAIERYEEELLRTDGRIDWVKCEVRPWYNSPGQVGGLIVCSEIITSYKQTERELRESKQLLQMVFDLLPQRVFWKDCNFRYLGCNKLFAQDALLDSPDQLIGKDDFELAWKESAPLYRADDATVIQNNLSRINYEESQIREDGTMIWLRTSKTPLRNDAGEIVGLLGTYEDITDYKRAQIALAQSEAKFRRLVEEASDYIFAFSREGTFTYISPQFTQFFGYDPAEFLGKPFTPLVHPDDLPTCLAAYQRLVETGQNESGLEFRHRCSDGRWCWSVCNLSPIRDELGNVAGYQGILRDIRDRKQAEAQLQEKEQFLRSIYDGVECFIFVIDVLPDGDFVYTNYNQFAERITGLRNVDIAGKTPEERFGAVEGAMVRQTLTQCVETGGAITQEECITFHDRQIWFLTTFNPLRDQDGRIYRIVGTGSIITDLKQAEAQLRQQTEDLEAALQELRRTQTQMVQSEKMSSLGQLVAGVAHEINNPVNFIYGNLSHANEYTQDLLRLLSLYQQHYPNPVAEIQAEADAIDLEFLVTDLPKLLSSLKIGADRIQKIVASLRSFSRLDEAEVKDVDIHEGIDSTLLILHNRLKLKPEYPPIQVVKQYGDLPKIECYAGQLNQVFMNILSNAIDALEDAIVTGKWPIASGDADSAAISNRTPMITIQTEQLDETQVAIRITDNGPGIPEAVQKRLFDPFFTTKAVGKGTGMGMSISHQVITERHRGHLRCYSSPGQGATFTIEIPIRLSH